MNKKEEADLYLEAINGEMNIIENFAYHDICLFYKGIKSIEELSKEKDMSPSNDGD